MTAVAPKPGPPGPQGPLGPAGPVGPSGPPGSAANSYDHNQGLASTVWTIVHNLNRRVSVTTYDSTGRLIEGDVFTVDLNTTTVTYEAAVGGSAHVI